MVDITKYYNRYIIILYILNKVYCIKMIICVEKGIGTANGVVQVIECN